MLGVRCANVNEQFVLMHNVDTTACGLLFSVAQFASVRAVVVAVCVC